MPKLTNPAGKAIYILAPEHVFMVRGPLPGEYTDEAKAVIVPIEGHPIAVRETPAEVARILGRE